LTPTITSTFTATYTSTSTPTVTPTSTPVILTVTIGDPFPNPVVKGNQIQVPIIAPTGSQLEWSVFTLGFRKILDRTQDIPGNQMLLKWDLNDPAGVSVSNGLYYLRVHVRGLKTADRILKVLVLK
jgi:hypothetical protein